MAILKIFHISTKELYFTVVISTFNLAVEEILSGRETFEIPSKDLLTPLAMPAAAGGECRHDTPTQFGRAREKRAMDPNI